MHAFAESFCLPRSLSNPCSTIAAALLCLFDVVHWPIPFTLLPTVAQASNQPKMANVRSTLYCILCLAVILVLVQLANAQASTATTDKLNTSLSLGLATILITVLTLMIVITMCLALGS